MIALLLAACSPGPAPSPTPSAATVVVNRAIEASIENTITSGQVGWSTINAVLVSVDGETKFAHYRNGSGPGDALHVWSITKSVVSALIGIAIDEQLIESLDQTLVELLPRYAEDMNAVQKSITLRQLMNMSAGYPSDQPVHNIHVVFESRRVPVPMILKDGPNTEPGAAFDYSSRSSHLVSAVLREALVEADGDDPRTVLDYAREKLFDPLDIDPHGHPTWLARGSEGQLVDRAGALCGGHRRFGAHQGLQHPRL